MLSNDFYPTPPPLLERMLRDVELHSVRSILEPSAGKGDICDVLKEKSLAAYPSHRYTVDVIEIDQDLQHILRGKGYNVVADDFLTFDTQKAYDLIIANFPFSEGDAHLQRALALLERSGGALVCLVNAETIRNPYTTLRKSVVHTLTNAGAEIEYVEGAFEHAERRTTVEVALIRVVMPRRVTDSIVLDALRRADPVVARAEAAAQLVDANPIAAMVARYALEARTGARLIDEYFALVPYIAEQPVYVDRSEETTPRGLVKMTVNDRVMRDVSSGINAYLESLREKYWRLLIQNEQFSSVYTSNVLRELERRMSELQQRDFSLFNIRALEEELRHSIRAAVEEAILSLFDEMSRKFSYLQHGNIHYYNGWKSNAAHKINRKVVLPMNGISAFSNRLEYHIYEKMADMVKVFQYLERDGVDVASTVGWATRRADQTGNFRALDMHYFTVTFFKKGTAHITFKDERLLDKFNIFAAQRRAWLPPGYGTKPYSAMDDEERAVVDAFQGQEAYARVVADADYYLVSDSALLLSAGDITSTPA